MDDPPRADPEFRREYQPWQRAIFATKLVVLPILFLGAAAGVVYGAIWISFTPPRQKLVGLGLLIVSVGIMIFAMWIALDRPKQWFAPGVNEEPVPGRRLPRWFRTKRDSFND